MRIELETETMGKNKTVQGVYRGSNGQLQNLEITQMPLTYSGAQDSLYS